MNSPRTLLEQRIRERRMSFEEFVTYAERFARQHREPGTLSVRHLNRLVRGEIQGAPRPATRRLLEAIFSEPWEALLAPPRAVMAPLPAEPGRLSIALRTAGRVDAEVVRLLAGQLDTIRQLDRRFGAAALLGQLRAHADHVRDLLAYTVRLDMRRALAAVLADAHALAGWQSLDQADPIASWQHFQQACDAARIAESPGLLSHAQAEQSVVLADAGETTRAVELAEHAFESARHATAPLVRAWLAAAHGEALAANGQQSASLRAFDHACALLPANPATREPASPYVALDDAHLARWRGHALARFGHPDAIAVLTDALTRHDPTFVRAETGLRADLALAYHAAGEREAAAQHRTIAIHLADEVGSTRQRRRLGNGA